MVVFIFVGDIGLENWSDNSHLIKILHQLSSVILKTDHSHDTKETVKNIEDGHSSVPRPLPPKRLTLTKKSNFDLGIFVLFWGY